MRRYELALLTVGLVSCVDERIAIAPWELQVRSAFVASEDGGVRVVLSSHDDVCAELSAFRCKRARYSNAELEGVWFDVWLPSSEQRKFDAAELSAAFRGRSPSAFFETKAQRGSIELVSKTNASATIAVDLEMDTGATVKGRFMASSCAETAFVRPFGGLECVETRADCDGGANVRCVRTTESCTCGGAQKTASCTATDRSSPFQYLMTCDCMAGALTMPCSMSGGPPTVGPTCCPGFE